jgi:hypothetical protein
MMRGLPMIREFIYTAKFDKEWAALGLTDNDLQPLEKHLLENPQAGMIMEGTGGIRKMRWVLPDRGKSGGIRILYLDYIFSEKICMFDLFPKDLKDNLTAAEKAALKKIVKVIGEGIRK